MFKIVKLVVAMLLCTTSVFCKRDEHAEIFRHFDNAKEADMAEKYMHDGIEPWEIEDDIRLYSNMFKWRYSNLMPH